MNNNLLSYLKGLKDNISYDKPATIIVGNEAADLDSMASAVMYAYYLSLGDESSNPFPLINIPRADFKLRTEAVFLFHEAGVNPDDLLFSEDIDLVKLKEKKLLSLVLVDHNKLSTGHSELKSCVTGILDHHDDENDYPKGIKTDIRPVGSGSTIVGEFFINNQSDFIKGSIGILILGTILLDTVNLDPAAGRVTGDDKLVADRIIEITGLESGTLFEKLQFEKFNVSSLGSYDLLRKDYKEWQMGSVKCGISSVLLSIEQWIEKDSDIVNACDKYLKERNLNVLFAMNAFTNPEFTRQIVAYIPEEKLREKAMDFLEASDLGLTVIDTSSLKNMNGCAFYEQSNLGISRKKLQPLLNEYFDK